MYLLFVEIWDKILFETNVVYIVTLQYTILNFAYAFMDDLLKKNYNLKPVSLFAKKIWILKVIENENRRIFRCIHGKTILLKNLVCDKIWWF